MELLSLLNKLFSSRDKQLIGILLVMSMIVSMIETASLSAVMLFVSVATNFDLVQSNNYYNCVYTRFGFTSPGYFVIALGFLLLIFYTIRGFLNVVHVFYLNKFAQMRQHYFAISLFKRFMHFSYQDFVMENFSVVSQTIFTHSANITQVVSGLLNIAAEFLTVACIYGMLFYVNWKMTLVLTLLLTIKVVLIIKAFSGKITGAGRRSQKYGLEAGKTLNETFNNYKFLKLLSRDDLRIASFRESHRNFAQANALNAVWQGLPRFILETMGFYILVSVMIYVIFRYNNAQFVVPIVSLYALAFYRFLPSVNKILMGYNQIIFNKHALRPVLNYLEKSEEKLGVLAVKFQDTITLQNVSFAYDKQPEVFNSVNLIIHKGERVGFVGESGAGKTTLVDVIIGLLQPKEGAVFIDKERLSMDSLKAWRQKIGYIPQSVTLFDGTVLENVVCGRPINESIVIDSLKKSHIYDFLSTKNGIHTRVGDAGIQLSGGQKQRIAIARALYGDPEILVLDEATSALDHETESVIMENIYEISRHKTLLVIAHRLTTIQRCDRIYRIENGLVYEDTHIIKNPSNKILPQSAT